MDPSLPKTAANIHHASAGDMGFSICRTIELIPCGIKGIFSVNKGFYFRLDTKYGRYFWDQRGAYAARVHEEETGRNLSESGCPKQAGRGASTFRKHIDSKNQTGEMSAVLCLNSQQFCFLSPARPTPANTKSTDSHQCINHHCLPKWMHALFVELQEF